MGDNDIRDKRERLVACVLSGNSKMYLGKEYIGYTMLGKTLIKMSPPSLSKFDIEDGVKLVAIVAMSDFMKDYLIKQKIIPNNI